jgi:hypothetical protein
MPRQVFTNIYQSNPWTPRLLLNRQFGVGQ